MAVVSILIVALFGSARAQLDIGGPGSKNNLFGGSKLCNASFANANASGIVTIDPGISQAQTGGGNYASSPVSWASTVYQGAGANDTELSLWFSPSGANYSDNYALGFDACYLWLGGFSINTFERGQSDTGDCLATLDTSCVSDLKAATNQFTVELVGEPTPGPNSNLTSASLPTVCGDLASMLTKNFPKSCAPFFEGPGKVYGGAPSLGGALTGPSSLVNASKCTTQSTYRLMWSQYGDGNLLTYTYANWWVTGLITAYMPIADVNRPVTLAFAKSFLTCLRAANVTAGSTPVGAAPAPTPISSIASSSNTSTSGVSTTSSSLSPSDKGDGLSGGAIAGVVIGVILGLALVAAVVFFFFRKRLLAARRAYDDRNGSAELDGSNSLLGGGYKGSVHEAPNTSTYYEMSTHTRPAELAHDQPPIELPVDIHSKTLHR